jgi:hypothetical protein
VVDVEIFLGFIVDVDLELRYLIFSFCNDEEVVSRQYFELLSFIFGIILRRKVTG